MARALWPGQDPIGKIVLNACSPERRVVGVVGDVRHLALEQASGNEMYIPDAPVRRSAVGAIWSIRSTRADGADRGGGSRRRCKPLAPNLAGNEFRTLQQLVDRSVSPRRFVVLMLGALRAVRAGARRRSASTR